MGMLIDGTWRGDVDRFMKDGSFRREPSALPRCSASELSEAIGDGTNVVLVASQSCPWSHRTTLVRSIKWLKQIHVATAGGPRTEGYALTAEDILGSVRHIHQLYTLTDASHTGRATVPLLWDAYTRQIICNDSATIARAFDRLGQDYRLVPAPQAAEINSLNARIYDGLSNAVYRAGFATTQRAYRAAVDSVFDTLEWLEAHLRHSRCLLGAQVTEADLCLFATLVRFDAVYAPLFRCTRRRLVDYPSLWAYARDVYSWPGVARTFSQQVNLVGYFQNDTENNPHGIVPDAPEADWQEPNGREALGALVIWQDGALMPFAEESSVDDA